MTAVTATPRSVALVPSASARAVLVLSRREALRILTRPVYFIIVGFFGLTVGVSELDPSATHLGRTSIHELLTIMLTYGALTTLFAASLVASSARRSGAESQLSATPLDPQLRTLATGLGVLLGPTSVAIVLTLALAFVQRGLHPPMPALFHDWEYLQLPLTWLGAGLLGIALARWLPWPGVPLAAFVALIAWTSFSARWLHDGHDIGFFMPYVISREEVFGLGAVSPDGHPAWHTVYLLGLCLLALAAALLRYRPLRERGVLAFAVLVAGLTVSAAWLQLP